MVNQMPASDLVVSVTATSPRVELQSSFNFSLASANQP